MNFSNLSDNRYVALEETRRLLGFKKSEWKSLLAALSKTDNGWFEFMRGDLTVLFEKFADIDEMHLEIKFDKDKVVKTINYAYDLSEFTKQKIKGIHVDCHKE
jgi:hypothetical protein